MKIIKRVHHDFQWDKETDELFTFEEENHWSFQVEMDNLIRADHLAAFLKELDREAIKYAFSYESRHTNGGGEYILIITFTKDEKEKTK